MIQCSSVFDREIAKNMRINQDGLVIKLDLESVAQTAAGPSLSVQDFPMQPRSVVQNISGMSWSQVLVDLEGAGGTMSTWPVVDASQHVISYQTFGMSLSNLIGSNGYICIEVFSLM